jgi:hypothetical protein
MRDKDSLAHDLMNNHLPSIHPRRSFSFFYHLTFMNVTQSKV